jgi:hypothetical protein
MKTRRICKRNERLLILLFSPARPQAPKAMRGAKRSERLPYNDTDHRNKTREDEQNR